MTGRRPERTPIFEEVAASFLAAPPGRHHWREDTPMARHGDDDGDHVANQADRDWRPDQRDPDAHDDAGCDQHQTDPDRWVGVTRDPVALAWAAQDEPPVHVGLDGRSVYQAWPGEGTTDG